MKEVYVLMEAVAHWRPCSRTEWVIAVCKDEEATIKEVNEKIKRTEEDFGRWSVNGTIDKNDTFDSKEITKNDLFKWWPGQDNWITHDYVFLTRFHKDGHRRDEWSFYVQKLPVKE